MLKRYFAILLVLVLALCALCACGSDGTHDDGTSSSDASSDTTPADSDAQTPTADILLSGLSQYAVVRPEEAEQEEIDAAVEIYNALKELGVSGMKTDFLKPGATDGKYIESDYEILVGQTNRAATAQLLDSMRCDDYAYAVVGTKIVIVGGSAKATATAAAAFVKDVVKAPHEDGVLMSDDDTVSFTKTTYPVDSLALAGTGIADFKIVYKASSKLGEKEMAASLSKAILTSTGYRMQVASDREAYVEGREILIGETSRKVDAYAKKLDANGYYLGVEGDFIVVNGGGSLGLATAVNELKKMITSAAAQGGSPAIELTETLGTVPETDRLTSMSFNLKVGSRSDERDARVVEMILKYMPDTIGVQEASPSWMNTLKKSISAYYNYVGEGRDGGDNGEYNAVFYLKDKFELVESGTKWLSASPKIPSRFPSSSLNRIYTYAQLRRISDGAEFVHVNTHLEHTSEAAREKQTEVLMKFIETKISLPILISGDFNCTAGSAPYKMIIAGGLTVSSAVAAQSDNAATFHGSSSKVIDFIFINTDHINVDTYHVCNEMINGDYASDHHPIIIEYYILR